jgi:hypothetical protein
MSALPPIADIRQRIEHVCFVPEADIRQRIEHVCFVPEADISSLRQRAFSLAANRLPQD